MNHETKQHASTQIWDDLYKNFQKDAPLGIQYPTEALVIFVSNLRKLATDVDGYFTDQGTEYSIRNNFSGNALEIGFGSIANLKMISEKGFNSHGLEVSREAVERGQFFLEKQGLANIKVQHWEPYILPFPDAHFSLIYGLGCVYYNLDLESVIEEVRRILVPGGAFFFSFFSNKHSYMNYIEPVDGHIFRWSDKHPNPRLRGAFLRQPKTTDELMVLFRAFKNVRVFTTESDQTPLFESWWYVTGEK